MDFTLDRFVRLALIVATMLTPAAAFSQTLTSSQPAALRDQPPSHEIAARGALTLLNGNIQGAAFDRHLTLVAIRYSRTILRRRAMTLHVTPEIVPGAWLAQPVLRGNATLRARPGQTRTETTFGMGAAPFGLEMRLLPGRRVQPIAGANGGFLYFNRNVPSSDSTRFNFTADIRLGARLQLARARALSIEYSYHHFSNAYRGVTNPAVDSQLLAVGYVAAWGTR